MHRRHRRHRRAYGWCGPGREESTEDLIAALERYQRDLEQEVADVAERIKRLRRQADAPSEKAGAGP